MAAPECGSPAPALAPTKPAATPMPSRGSALGMGLVLSGGAPAITVRAGKGGATGVATYGRHAWDGVMPSRPNGAAFEVVAEGGRNGGGGGPATEGAIATLARYRPHHLRNPREPGKYRGEGMRIQGSPPNPREARPRTQWPAPSDGERRRSLCPRLHSGLWRVVRHWSGRRWRGRGRLGRFGLPTTFLVLLSTFRRVHEPSVEH